MMRTNRPRFVCVQQILSPYNYCNFLQVTLATSLTPVLEKLTSVLEKLLICFSVDQMILANVFDIIV